MKVNALDHLVINVSDVDRSAKWYATILGMEVKVFDPGPGKTPRTSLVFGDQKINVRPRNADKVEWFTADHETAGSDDLCFLTSSTPEQVVAHLNQGDPSADQPDSCGRDDLWGAGIPRIVQFRDRHRLRPRRPLLRRTGLDHAGLRLRLHLCLRHPG